MTPDPRRALRVALVHEGRILCEQIVRPGRAVTFGAHAGCTLSAPELAPTSSFTIFSVARGGAFELRLPPGASARVARDGEMLSVEDGDAPLRLEAADRGRLRAGEITVLFQLVPVPLAADVGRFRPRLIEEDDPVFLGFLSTSAAAAAVFLVLVASTPPRESLPPEAIPDRFVEVLLTPPELPPPVAEAPPAREPDPEAPPVPAEREAPEGAEADAVDVGGPSSRPSPEAVAAEVERRSALLSSLRNLGEGPSHGVFSHIDHSGDQLGRALEGVHAEELAAGGAPALREGWVGQRGDADIGRLKGVEGGRAVVGQGPATRVAGALVNPPEEAELPEGLRGDVLATLKNYRGQVIGCYESALRLDPTLSGRLDLTWTIEAGRVRSVQVVGDSLGDPELSACVVRRVRGWRFDAATSGEVVMPFVLTPAG